MAEDASALMVSSPVRVSSSPCRVLGKLVGVIVSTEVFHIHQHGVV